MTWFQVLAAPAVEKNLKILLANSSFNEAGLDVEFARMNGPDNGTVIFIYDLAKWDNVQYKFTWDGSDGDIVLNPRCARPRIRQTSEKVDKLLVYCNTR